MCWEILHRFVQKGGKMMHWPSQWHQCHHNVFSSPWLQICVVDVGMNFTNSYRNFVREVKLKTFFTQTMVRKPNLLRAILNNFPPGLVAWVAVSSLAQSVSWQKLYKCFNNQMSKVNDLLRIICTTNWYKKYQLESPHLKSNMF